MKKRGVLCCLCLTHPWLCMALIVSMEYELVLQHAGRTWGNSTVPIDGGQWLCISPEFPHEFDLRSISYRELRLRSRRVWHIEMKHFWRLPFRLPTIKVEEQERLVLQFVRLR